ncbi:MAG TPA: hypothetical protein EYP62_06705, partial [Kiritimatiellae bacterium]|nr:hypothetical protein [Kiritimatiellia bacterium]
MQDPGKWKALAGCAAALALGAILLWNLVPPGGFPSSRWPWALLLVPVFAVSEWRHRRLLFRGRAHALPRDHWPVLVLLGVMTAFLISRGTESPTFYFLRWNGTSGGPAYKAWVVRLFLYSALATPFFLLESVRRRAWLILFAVLVYGQWECIHEFLARTGGLALYRDDHPSFMYRLWAFSRVFPRLVYYDPNWNGGGVATYLISSGVTAIGLLLWPVWRWLPVETAYTPVVAFLFMVLVPLVTVAAVRAVRGSWTAAFAAGTMALLVNRLYLLWLLHFGTLGCCFSLAFSGLLAALLYRVAAQGDTRPRVIAALVIAAYCYLVWPPAGVFWLAMLPAFLATARGWNRRVWTALLAAAAATALLLLPNVAGVLAHVDVGHYVGTGQRHVEWGEQLLRGWRRLAAYARRGHPLLVFLGVLGAPFLPGRRQRRYWTLAVAGFAAIAAWGHMWRPNLEFPRAGFVLFFVACIPAGLWVGGLLEARSARLAPLQAALIVLLVIAGMNAADLYENRGIERYNVMSREVRDFVAWVRANVPSGARLLFAGPTVHGYGGGHVALLPALTGREMMACDYYHFSMKKVEYEYPPRGYRSYRKMLRFLRSYNVSHIVTFRKYWQRRLEGHPDRFTPVHQFGRPARPKKVYRVEHTPSIFLKGSGRVSARLNELEVIPDDPSGEVVIKYNWAHGLKAQPPAVAEPFRV